MILLTLGATPASWPESSELRRIMGDLAGSGKWIKRMDYAARVFRFAFPLLPDTSSKLALAALWTWVQRNV